MSEIPSRTYHVTGLPLHRAPTYLLPYLDSVHGAVATGGIVGPRGATHAQWALIRDGEEVGRVLIELPEGELP